MNDSAPEKTLESPPPAEAVTVTGFHADDTATQFVSKLSSQFSKDELGTWFRLTLAGVFCDERAKETLLSRYEKWISTEIKDSGTLSKEKLNRRLFGEGEPHPVYVVEGSASLAGYMLTPKLEWKPQFGLPLYKGRPLDAMTTLHPKDPLLSSIPGVVLSAGSSGIEIRFTVREKPVILNLAMLNATAKASLDVRKFKADFENLGHSLRSLVKILAEHFPRSHTVKRTDPCFVPRALRSAAPDCIIIQLYSLLFILNNEGKVLACLSSDGKAQRERILDELRALREGDRAPRIKDFYIDVRRRPHIGSVKNVTRSYNVEFRALLEFLDLIGETEGIPVAVPSRFDIVDLLKSFTAAFQAAEAPRDRPHTKDSNVECRRIGNIEFSISKALAVVGVTRCYMKPRPTTAVAPKKPQ